MAHESSTTTQTTNKRKRSNIDNEPPRSAPGYTRGPANDTPGEMEYGVDDNAINQLSAFNNQEAQQNGGAAASATDTAAAALSHYQMGGDASFQTQASAGDTSFMADQNYGLDQLKESPTQAQGPTSQQSPTSATPSKPPVGSDEWHKVRRDNHKEVERRRRETINEGINELAKIVPGCEKNKGSILQRAVQYIGQLRDAETTNLEKWTLEKLLLDQAINELSTTCDRLKSDCQRAWDEKEMYKRACDNARLVPDEMKDREDGVNSAEG